LGDPEPVQTGQRHADNAVLDQVRDGAGRPGAGSRSALLKRLARLAPWHPSAIHASERGAVDRRKADRQDPDQPEFVQLASRRRQPERSESAGPESERPEPERPASYRPESDRPGSGLRESADRREPEAGRQESGQGSPSAPDSLPRTDGPRQQDPPEGSFWDKVPWFRALWRDHVERWPDRRSEPGRLRPDDRQGTWRGEGDRYLSPERNAEADEQIALLQRPEEAVTSVLVQIERENPLGGVLVGLEHRLKAPDRLKEKIVDKMADARATLAEAAEMIDDAVRYTFCFGNVDYVAGDEYVRQKLESAGCTMTYGRNHWLDDPQYKGVNSRWQSPDGGRFELQFHTRASFFVKEELTHPSYGRLRQPTTSRRERLELAAFERLVSAAVPVPPDISRISDYGVGT